MDSDKAQRVAEALGVDLTCPEEDMPYANEIAVLLDERDALRAELASLAIGNLEAQHRAALRNKELSAELAARTAEYCTAIANLQAENERLRNSYVCYLLERECVLAEDCVRTEWWAGTIWTPSAWEAIQFVRKSDAEEVRLGSGLGELPINVRVTEHVFDKEPQP